MSNQRERRKDKLQELCREYLGNLRHIARKYGLEGFVRDMMNRNKRKECVATEREVKMLARISNRDRIRRVEVPPILGKTYRECNDADLFGNIDRIENRSSYSRVSAELYGNELKYKERKHNG